jgi:phosphoribosylformylglycinamidine synthase
MKFIFKVEVSLKQGLSNPEGEVISESLKNLDYNVLGVNISKIYYVHLEADSLEKARKDITEISERLLANPIKDNFRIEVEKN